MNIKQKLTRSSPFPNKLRNKSLVDISKSIILTDDLNDNRKIYKHLNFTNKDKSEKILMNVTPNTIKKYMYDNTFYYDLKNWREFNKPTNVSTKKLLRSSEKAIKEPIFKDKTEITKEKFNSRVNHAYLASIVLESDISRILKFKDVENKFDMHERERIMLHDNSAFKNRSFSAKRNSSKYDKNQPPKAVNNLNYKSSKNFNANQVFTNIVKSPHLHKCFSQVPDYIKQFKVRDKIEREYEKLIEEESTYPKGTYLIPEDLRLNVLSDLKLIRKFLLDCIEKCPITVNFHSTGVINKKRDLEAKINEVEKHIDLFNKKKVFLKS